MRMLLAKERSKCTSVSSSVIVCMKKVSEFSEFAPFFDDNAEKSTFWSAFIIEFTFADISSSLMKAEVSGSREETRK